MPADRTFRIFLSSSRRASKSLGQGNSGHGWPNEPSCFYTGAMNDVQESDYPDASPGKIRTVWHPLLVRLLASMLAPAFRVEKEVAVGEPPLFVDILLIRQEWGQLSESNTRDLAELLPLLNLFTLIEFKGPTDALQWGDFSRLLGCAFL